MPETNEHMQIQANISYDHGGRPQTHYSNLKPGSEFWNWIFVPDSQLPATSQ